MGQHEYALYDGRDLIGNFVVKEKTGKAKAFDAIGRSLGTFDGYDAARHAINKAHRNAVVRKVETAEALERLNRPIVEFMSGLPERT